MAIKTLVDHYKNLMKTKAKEIGKVSGLGDKVVLDLALGGEAYVKAIKKGAEPIVQANFMNKKANDSKYWRDAVNDAVTEIKQTGKCRYKLNPWNNNIKTRGIYLVPDARRSASILIRFIKDETSMTVNDPAIQSLALEFRNIVYNKWVDVVTKAFPQNLFGDQTSAATASMPYKGGTKKISTQMSQNTNISHQPGTTVAQLSIAQLRKSKPSINAPLDLEVLKVFDFAEDNMQISWGRTSKKNKVGDYTYDTYVKAKLEYNVKNSKQTADTKAMLTQYERATAEYVKTEIMNPNSVLFGLTMEASKTIKEQVTEDVIVDIVKGLVKNKKVKGRKVTNKVKAKKFKAERREPKVVKHSKGIGNLSQEATLVIAGTLTRGRPQKKERSNTANIQKVETLINKRLPAEVRRNMGRPALINQTGRFSNSTKVNLRETPAGISGEYTYLTSPYETFENTGSRKWPVGYNPKPLITKSIRNLAMQYTTQKLVSLRRV